MKQQIQLQFWNKSYPYYIDWVCDINNVKIGDIIFIKNDKQKINGYMKKLSDLIIGCLANHSRYLIEYSDFIKFAKSTIDSIKYSKESFNSIPFFKFKIIDIYDNILVVNPMNIENDYNKNYNNIKFN